MIELGHKANIELILFGYKINVDANQRESNFKIFGEVNGIWELYSSGSICWNGSSELSVLDNYFFDGQAVQNLFKAIDFCFEFAKNNIFGWDES